MMYLIAGILGLLVGAGFGIWAIIERSKKAKAENQLLSMTLERDKVESVAKNNAEMALKMSDENTKLQKNISLLEDRLNSLRKRLVESNDINAIKSWLDDELKEEVV